MAEIGSLYGTGLPKCSLVIGGARSGKSAFAEKLVASAGCPRVYVATAEAKDDEMAARIARHRADRAADRGGGWRLVEAPLDLGPTLARAVPDEVVLIDCVTLWLSNHLLLGHDLGVASARLREGLAATAARIVLVSNEVGWAVVPDNPLARAFADAQGRLNQWLAADADLVVAVIAGLPVVLKSP